MLAVVLSGNLAFYSCIECIHVYVLFVSSHSNSVVFVCHYQLAFDVCAVFPDGRKEAGRHHLLWRNGTSILICEESFWPISWVLTLATVFCDVIFTYFIKVKKILQYAFSFWICCTIQIDRYSTALIILGLTSLDFDAVSSPVLLFKVDCSRQRLRVL